MFDTFLSCKNCEENKTQISLLKETLRTLIKSEIITINVVAEFDGAQIYWDDNDFIYSLIETDSILGQVFKRKKLRTGKNMYEPIDKLKVPYSKTIRVKWNE